MYQLYLHQVSKILAFRKEGSFAAYQVQEYFSMFSIV